jgi:glycosyltransferase involved in cell wall biosynthesis
MQKISVIIPVYNEKKTISETVRKVFDFFHANFEKEIIIVDDGSDDGSREILEDLRNKYGFRLLSHKNNQGKGAAIRTGFASAQGDIVLIQDADAEYDPSDWKPILDEFNNPEMQAVFGSRNLNPQKRGYWHYVLGVKILTGFINFLFRADLTDSYTCYKFIRRKILQSLELNSDGFEIEAEIASKLLKGGVKIKELPISYAPRSFAEGKKINFQDGLKGMWTIFKIWIS